jgi:putative tricarboxylic transport membrane protein
VSGEAAPTAAEPVSPAQSIGTAILSAALFMIFAGVFIGAGSFSPDASLFPRLIAVLAMLSAAFAFVQSFREALARRMDAQALSLGSTDWRDVAISYAGPPLYCGLMVLLGFWLSSAIFLAGLLYLLGTRRIPVILALTGGTLALIYVAFELVFGIPLPSGMLFDVGS